MVDSMTTIGPVHSALWEGRAPAIAVAGCSKRFGPVTALADVSFDVWPGTIVSLVGPKGSGKTTVLRTLLGQIEPTSGSALFDTLRYRDLCNRAASSERYSTTKPVTATTRPRTPDGNSRTSISLSVSV